MLNTGIFPDKLEIAKIIPFYKKKMRKPNSLVTDQFLFCLQY